MEFIGPSTAEREHAYENARAWKWRFAFKPTHVATTKDGRDIKIWLKFYQRRHDPAELCYENKEWHYTRYKDYPETKHGVMVYT